jgi:hypothetical protein
MTENNWTLDPQINASMETFELPSASFLEKLMAERAPIEAGAPRVGEPAPEFEVQWLSEEGLSEDGTLTDERVGLADYRGRDLALIFGNLTCPIYRGQIRRFNEIYAKLKDRYAFLLIYIREAHPEDGWQVEINRTQTVIYDQPVSTEERAAIAQTCVRQHLIDMPVAVDDMDDTINNLYAGSPERLYLIDADGIVRHRSVAGPFKLGVIETWYQVLKENV